MSINPSDAWRHGLLAQGLQEIGYHPSDPGSGRRRTWRLSPAPLTLSNADVEWLHALGPHVQSFNAAADELYLASVAGRQPGWIARYLDTGKPESLINYSRTRQAGRARPTVIRPDVIPTPQGMLIAELDAVPGGMGIIARASELYNALGHTLLGDNETLPRAFADMVKAVAMLASPSLAIVVSDESAAYRPEMVWLSKKLTNFGITAVTVAPEDLTIDVDSVTVPGPSGDVRIDVVYRFFELFDLRNVANADALMSLNAQGSVAVVPPFRPFFEEKMWAAFLHQPALTGYWRTALGAGGYEFLSACMPPTWILDPAPDASFPAFSGLSAGGAAVTSWERLKNLGRKQRQFVIKPSGFSERAWGSRGVIMGHDLGTWEWNAALAQAVDAFAESPHLLQEFRAGRHFDGTFYDDATGATRTIPCRVRLSPYYLIVGDEVRLTTVMATMCPLDKKRLHGMPDAIIVPCCTDGQPAGGER